MNQQLTEDQLKDIEALGERIGFLLKVARLSDEMKQEIIRTIPAMNADQLLQLEERLAQLLPNENSDLDVETAKRVEEIKAEYKNEQEKILDNEKDELNAIHEELNQLES